MARLEGDAVTVRPIAGTRPRSADPDVDRQREVELLVPLDEATLLGQLADPDASVRAGLASAAVWRCAPFNRLNCRLEV